ncbi:MAG: hypothetical protein KC613_26310, partial [Myxococcales bacterium]|nr:hypothetical protein [Myxococcales bacterium]
MSLSEDRKRTLLLVGILGVVLGTGLVQYLWQQKREAAAVAQANRPEARAQAALQDADRATLAHDLGAADQALLRAREALDAVLLERPTDEGALRSRLVVARRLANVAEQAGRAAQAREHLSDAWRRAQALFEAQRTGERARLDLLTVARELAAVLDRAGEHSAAAQRTEEAAKAVEGSLKGLTPPHTVRLALVDTWEAAARGHGAAKTADAAIAAARQAIAHAEGAVKTSDQPAVA